MLLTFEQMGFLSKVTVKDKDGLLIANADLSEADKEKLLDIDEAYYMTNGEHWIKNIEDLE